MTLPRGGRWAAALAAARRIAIAAGLLGGPLALAGAQEPVTLVFAHSTDKAAWIAGATARFAAGQPRTASGDSVVVETEALPSVDLGVAVGDGELRAHLLSPTSAMGLALANARAVDAGGDELVPRSESLLVSPLVVATWQPCAAAFGGGGADWAAVVRSSEPAAWTASTGGKWGSFRFGHAHPEHSDSGMLTVLAVAHAALGGDRPLRVDDLSNGDVGALLARLERTVVHYGSDGGVFGDAFARGGPTSLSAAVVFEHTVVSCAQRAATVDLPHPVVAIYPRDGTYWSDHPCGVVQREWVTAAHREAAQLYVEHLLSEKEQRAAMQLGFRPVHPAVGFEPPLDGAHGVDARQPQASLPMPSIDVLRAGQSLWAKHKKHSDVVLVFDTSGSMKGARLHEAKRGVEQLLQLLGEEDRVSFLQFSDELRWLARDQRVGDARPALLAHLRGLEADGGTALYDALASAHDHLQGRAATGRTTAVVALSDGADRNSQMQLAPLVEHLQAARGTDEVRIFAIAYGNDVDRVVVDKIADVSRGRSYTGSVDTIRAVFRDISTLF